MSPRMQKQVANSKEQALAAFVSKKAEIDAMLSRLPSTIATTMADTAVARWNAPGCSG
jgi:hypothetical protein